MRVDEHVRIHHKLDPASVRNWAPYCTEMLQLGLDVEFPEGLFVIGDSTPPAPSELYAAHPSNRRSLVWGWGSSVGRRVSIIGAGMGRTVLKVADNLIHGMDPEHSAYKMLLSRGEGEKDAHNCPALVSGITFDGNHRANGVYTVAAMRVIGIGTEVRECEFVDFAPGGFTGPDGSAMHTPECFIIASGLPSGAPQGSKGTEVIGCRFRLPGAKSISPPRYTTENTYVAIGGNMPESIMAGGVRVEGCHFEGHFDRKTQQAPLHGISISSCNGSIIRNNTFKDFEGFCIYTDSGQQFNTLIEGNTATNVWGFVQYTCQNWPRYGARSWQITRFENVTIRNNTVTLTTDPTTYAWDAPDGKSTFMGYLYDRDLDPTLYPGFVNVQILDNKVTVPAGSTFVANYGGYKDGGWKPGDIVGDVPGIIILPNKINVKDPAPTPPVQKEVEEVRQVIVETSTKTSSGSSLPLVAIILLALL